MVDKPCSKCKKVLPLTEFSKDKCQKNGYRPSCRDCSSHIRRKSTYNLDQEDYEKILDQQNERCAICGVHQNDTYHQHRRGFHVDHCHDTGVVRALLCSPCNRGIGFLKDDQDLAQKAADYLKYHNTKNKENHHR